MNRLLAAHNRRKDPRTTEAEASTQLRHGVSSRAAQAAARVAARYAKAPSHSQALWGEAQSTEPGPGPVPDLATGPAIKVAPELRPEPVSEMAPAVSMRGLGAFRNPEDDWLAFGAPEGDGPEAGEIEVAEAAQPIPANLIEFPRELVATRKMRPRLAEGPFAALSRAEEQLSIFEVDPGSISTQPVANAAAGAAVWPHPEWSGMELDEEPEEQEPARQIDGAKGAERAGTATDAAEAATAPAAIQLAPTNLRLMAGVVDGALIVGAFLAAALVAAANARDLPPLRVIELGAAAALAVIGMVYQVLFFTLGEGTPGMKYAHLSLCTFDDRKPTRAQLRGRLGALLLSLLPVGLGVAWAIFDEEHLSWHDRLSGTYLRRD